MGDFKIEYYNANNETKGEQKNCSICLEDFVVGDKIIYLPCFHYYHANCIEKWTQSSDKCPLCNIEIKIQ